MAPRSSLCDQPAVCWQPLSAECAAASTMLMCCSSSTCVCPPVDGVQLSTPLSQVFLRLADCRLCLSNCQARCTHASSLEMSPGSGEQHLRRHAGCRHLQATTVLQSRCGILSHLSAPDSRATMHAPAGGPPRRRARAQETSWRAGQEPPPCQARPQQPRQRAGRCCLQHAPGPCCAWRLAAPACWGPPCAAALRRAWAMTRKRPGWAGARQPHARQPVPAQRKGQAQALRAPV